MVVADVGGVLRGGSSGQAGRVTKNFLAGLEDQEGVVVGSSPCGAGGYLLRGGGRLIRWSLWLVVQFVS